MLKGNTFKDIVKALLERSDYAVYPYGYESTFSDIKHKLRAEGARNSLTARRIRSSPDLLVYDDQRKDVMLVEVKMSSYACPWIKQWRIETYKQFWNDSILVLVVPVGNVFYAQRISELEVKQQYDVTKDFEKFEDIFTRAKPEVMSHSRVNALQNMKKQKTSESS